jgi:hypothetical protein
LLFTKRSCNCFQVSRSSLKASAEELSSEQAVLATHTMANPAVRIVAARTVNPDRIFVPRKDWQRVIVA